MASMPLEGLLSLGFAYCYKLSFHVLFREINSDPFFVNPFRSYLKRGAIGLKS